MAGSRWALQRRDAVVVGALALAVRLFIVLVRPPGDGGDFRGYVDAARVVTLEGIHAVYSHPLQALYPPAFFYPLWAAGQLYTHCCSPEFDVRGRTVGVLLRLPTVLTDTAVATIVYVAALQWADRRRARWAGVAYALNPAVLFTAPLMGMLGEPHYLLAAVISVLAAQSGHYSLAAASIVLGIMLKPQALALLPLIAFLIWVRGTPRQIVVASLSALGAAFVVLFPFFVWGTTGDVLRAVGRMTGHFPFVHMQAANGWYLVTGGHFLMGARQDSDLLWGLLSYRDAGLLAFGALYLVALRWLIGRRRPEVTIAVAAVITFAFFMLTTRQHVNYVFPVFAFLSMLSITGNRRLQLVLFLTTTCCVANWLLYRRMSAGIVEALYLVDALLNAVAFVLLLVAVQSFIAARETPSESAIDADIQRLGVGPWLRWLRHHPAVRVAAPG